MAPTAPPVSRPHPRGVDLSAHTDRALDSPSSESIEQHIQTCARCAATVLAYRGISSRLRRLPEVPTPASLGGALRLTRLRAPRRSGAARSGHEPQETGASAARPGWRSVLA
jgi:anti-sigma factor RsiW